MRCAAISLSSGPEQDPSQVIVELRSLEARSLAGPALEVQAAVGTELVREGQQLATFYVICSGDAELSADGRRLGTLHPGDCFGEIDPVSPREQRFTVTAGSPMQLLTFSAFGIARLCAAIPGSRQRILASLPQP
jgi:CRP-like cAMP-binding protein